MGKLLGSLLGGGKAPKVSGEPLADTEAEKKKAKTARSALLTTEGGILGSELTPGQVGRTSLLGN